MHVQSLSTALGAEVTGVDLNQPPDTETGAALMEALTRHIVLVIRDQALSPENFLTAMKALGEPAPQNNKDVLMDGFPEIMVLDSRVAKPDKTGERNLFGAKYWHTDHVNQALPPKLTALYAKRLPPTGGDTCFANARVMYESLEPSVRLRVDSMTTVNGADWHLDAADLDQDAFEDGIRHPLAPRHPVTGERALYLHPLKLKHIDGMGRDDSFAFVDDLLENALVPDVIYRHKWRVGDLALIDNRACLHRAMRDYDPDAGRLMHRIILKGDRPSV